MHDDCMSVFIVLTGECISLLSSFRLLERILSFVRTSAIVPCMMIA